MSLQDTDGRYNAAAQSLGVMVQRQQDSEARAIASLREAFLALARGRNVTADATFARWVTDYEGPKLNGCYLSRVPRLSEVMAESLDYSNGPQLADVLKVLVDVAYGDQPQIAAARDLINRMAAKWADQNVYVTDADPTL